MAVAVCTPSTGRAEGITVYVGSEIDTFDPHHTTTFAGHAVANTLHQGLLRYDSSGRLSPDLAEDWEVSRDGLTYTFTLKPDLVWSDGRVFHAKDVAAGLRRALTPNRPSPFASKLYPIVNAEAYATGALVDQENLGVAVLDAQTISIVLERRDTSFLDVLAHPVSKPVPHQGPELIADGSVALSPYRVTEQTGGRVIMSSTGQQSALTFQPINTVEQAWQESEGHQTFVTMFPIVKAPSIEERANVVKMAERERLYAYAFNMDRVPFDTLEIRHALAMAINRPKLLDDLFIDLAVPATQFVPPSVMTYAESYGAPFASLTFEEREAVAEALLVEQGIDAGSNFVVRLRIPEGDIHNDVADAVAHMWAVIGIETNIIQAPMPEHWNAVQAGDFDVAFASWPSRQDSPLGSLEPLSRSAGPWNFSRYKFVDFNERLARAAESVKEEVTSSYYREAEKALIEDQSLLALFFYRPMALVSPNIVGWQNNPTGLHPLTELSIAQ